MNISIASGKEVATLAEAEQFLKNFIIQNRAKGVSAYDVHSQDFDLYLPWMLECLHSEKGNGSLTPCELNEVYMDAAWSLVMKGYLRPGPRSCSGASSGTSYGKGYALTQAGKEWIGANPVVRLA